MDVSSKMLKLFNAQMDDYIGKDVSQDDQNGVDKIIDLLD